MSSFVNESSLPSAVLMVPEPEDHEVTDPRMFLPDILEVKRILKWFVGLLNLVMGKVSCDLVERCVIRVNVLEATPDLYNIDWFLGAQSLHSRAQVCAKYGATFHPQIGRADDVRLVIASSYELDPQLALSALFLDT